MLDTNTASYIIKGHLVEIQAYLLSVPLVNNCISAITEAELLRGIAKKLEAVANNGERILTNRRDFTLGLNGC